jgi:hypothetical protein
VYAREQADNRKKEAGKYDFKYPLTVAKMLLQHLMATTAPGETSHAMWF